MKLSTFPSSYGPWLRRVYFLPDNVVHDGRLLAFVDLCRLC